MPPTSAPVISSPPARPDAPPAVGLRANWRQFTLLVVVNAFVGAMVGLERAILPLLADREFGLNAGRSVLSFVLAFGLSKAVANLVAGSQSARLGRKPLLLAGWIVGLPVPFLLAYAPSWSWIVGANVLLGINQGLCWSMTVIMKIDLAGPRRRGLAMGLNESAGYAALAIAAWAGAVLGADLGLRAALFAGGLTCAASGLVLSAACVRETRAHGDTESDLRDDCAGLPPHSFRRVFVETTATDRNLSSATQAGLVNNLNDGVAWGLFPLLFAAGGSSVGQVGALAAVYPAVWSAAQLASGALSDRWGRKWLIAAGMWTQAIGIALTAAASTWLDPAGGWLTGAVLLGLGTALVYPTLLAAIGDAACPAWRPAAVGVYRLWRDLGYVAGAIVCGVTAEQFGLRPAIYLAALLTCASGVVVALRMKG